MMTLEIVARLVVVARVLVEGSWVLNTALNFYHMAFLLVILMVKFIKFIIINFA